MVSHAWAKTTSWDLQMYVWLLFCLVKADETTLSSKEAARPQQTENKQMMSLSMTCASVMECFAYSIWVWGGTRVLRCVSLPSIPDMSLTDWLRIIWKPCWCKWGESTVSTTHRSWGIVRTGYTFGTGTYKWDSWVPDISCVMSSNACYENMPKQTKAAERKNLFVCLAVVLKSDRFVT